MRSFISEWELKLELEDIFQFNLGEIYWFHKMNSHYYYYYAGVEHSKIQKMRRTIWYLGEQRQHRSFFKYTGLLALAG